MNASVSSTRAFSCLSFELGEEIITISDSYPLFLSLSFALMKITFSFTHGVHNQGGNRWSDWEYMKNTFPAVKFNAIFNAMSKANGKHTLYRLFSLVSC